MSIDNIVIDTSFKVQDYSKHKDINEYLGSILKEEFREYRHRWEEASNMKRLFDFPLFLVFETMFNCNLRCIMCIHSSKNKKRYAYKGKMPLTSFKKIMKEARTHYCPSLTIGGSSEPLLDNNIAEMIKLARKSGFIDVMLNTNATLLTREMSRQLIENGLTRLRIGFDGLTASTYEKIRIGADFENVKNNIISFMKLREEMNSKLPVVRISCVHLSKNDREITSFIEFWKPMVDYVSIQKYKPHEFTKERLKISPRKKVSSKKILCSQPFERLYIRGNGDVHACCRVVYGPKAGNISKNSIYDIWNSDSMNVLRNALKNADLDNLPPSCRECLINTQLV